MLVFLVLLFDEPFKLFTFSLIFVLLCIILNPTGTHLIQLLNFIIYLYFFIRILFIILSNDVLFQQFFFVSFAFCRHNFYFDVVSPRVVFHSTVSRWFFVNLFHVFIRIIRVTIWNLNFFLNAIAYSIYVYIILKIYTKQHIMFVIVYY